jgi:hypothetical protein
LRSVLLKLKRKVGRQEWGESGSGDERERDIPKSLPSSRLLRLLRLRLSEVPRVPSLHCSVDAVVGIVENGRGFKVVERKKCGW